MSVMSLLSSQKGLSIEAKWETPPPNLFSQVADYIEDYLVNLLPSSMLTFNALFIVVDTFSKKYHLIPKDNEY